MTCYWAPAPFEGECVMPPETPDPGNSIAAAINEAEEVQDPLDVLVERSKTDPGAAFETENLELIHELRKRNPAAYERLRAALKKTHVRTIELEKRLAQKFAEASVQVVSGTPLIFEDVEPWDEAVDGVALLAELVVTIARHLVCSAQDGLAVALWVLFAHAHDAFSVSPRLALTSPQKRCGKTTALWLLQCLVPRPLPAANITAAALFRSVEIASPTVLVDEADSFLAGHDELRGILNSGHSRASCYVIRTVGDDYTPTTFKTWAPLVMAMIGSLPDTLADALYYCPPATQDAIGHR